MSHQGGGTHLALQLDVALEMQRAILLAALQLIGSEEDDVGLPRKGARVEVRGGVVQREHDVAKLGVHDRHCCDLIVFWG